MSSWFCNGIVVDSVAVDDRGFHYGDGLFETCAIRDGAPRLWSHHMDRLQRGCDVLGLAAPRAENLLSSLHDALQNCPLRAGNGLAKLVLTAGPGERGYGRKGGIEPGLFIGISAYVAPPVDFYRDGVDTLLCRTTLASDSPLAGLKTLNRLEQVLARSEVLDKDLFEGLTTDVEGNVICGTMSNVFFVNDNVISTPSLGGCGVSGVMRRFIIEVLENSGSEIEYRSTHATAIGACDEIFLSNSQFGVLPIRSCGDLLWPVGKMTKRVMSLIADNGIKECRA